MTQIENASEEPLEMGEGTDPTGVEVDNVTTDPGNQTGVMRANVAHVAPLIVYEEAERSETPGLKLILSQDMARSLQAFFMNKKWEGEIRDISKKNGHVEIDLPSAVYSTRGEGARVLIKFTDRRPPDDGFQLEKKDVVEVLAYKDQKRWNFLQQVEA